ncbi:MAG: Lrp/AsnC ligand binding domain-containing protein [Planctomycetes bacterium]|nr:Lrp/AsnC ligand binding domain-containing protein [Planctomycetota bacterium]
MGVGAYVFINVKSGNGMNAVEDIRKVKGVKQAHLVTGLHDVIAYLEANDVNELGKTIVTQLQKVPGVDRTVTCLTVKS